MAVHIDFWLVHQRELFQMQCRLDVLLQLMAFHQLRMHVLGEEPEFVTTRLFRLIHGDISILQEYSRVAVVVGIYSNSDRSRDRDLPALHDERFQQ